MEHFSAVASMCTANGGSRLYKLKIFCYSSLLTLYGFTNTTLSFERCRRSQLDIFLQFFFRFPSSYSFFFSRKKKLEKVLFLVSTCFVSQKSPRNVLGSISIGPLNYHVQCFCFASFLCREILFTREKIYFCVDCGGRTRYLFYITLHWRGVVTVCVNEEPKTFRSQSNEFFSSTEVAVLNGQRYKVYEAPCACVSASVCQRVTISLAKATCSNTPVRLCAMKKLCWLRRRNVCVYKVSVKLWRDFCSFHSSA